MSFYTGHLPAMIPVDAELLSVATAKPLYGSFAGSVVNKSYSVTSWHSAENVQGILLNYFKSFTLLSMISIVKRLRKIILVVGNYSLQAA